GLVGRLFREFAMTLSVAILISLVVSLTTTPMMCAYLVTHRPPDQRSRWYVAGERVFDAMLNFYDGTLQRALRRPGLVMLILLLTVCLNVYLFILIPKGLFPTQDTGRLIGGIQADQSISFQSMREKLKEFVKIVRQDPAVQSVVGFTGGGQTNSGFVFVALKPLAERELSVDQVMGRLRGKLARVPGARLFLQPVQDIRVGGRQSNALYQYTLQSDNLTELYDWAPKVTAALEQLSELTEVNSDQQQKGLESDLVIDRPTAARLGITAAQIDNTLYDAFGQRQVSVIYAPRNQYHVVMEVAPQFWQSPDTLDQIYISTAGGAVKGTQATNALPGTVSANTRASTTSTTTNSASTTAAQLNAQAVRNQATNAIANSGRGATSTGAAVSTAHENMVPLSAIARYQTSNIPLAVNHQGLFVASTISFNLKPGVALSDASRVIEEAMARLHVPTTVRGHFAGTAKLFEESLANEPILIG